MCVCLSVIQNEIKKRQNDAMKRVANKFKVEAK